MQHWFKAALSAVQQRIKAPKGTQSAALAARLGTTFDHPGRGLTPLKLHDILESAEDGDITAQAELFADGQSVDTASNTASYDLTFDTAALPLEYTAYLLGHSIENGVMKAGKDDVAPYFAVLFQSDKRNGKKRYTKFYKVQFTEPSESGNSKQESIQFDTPTLTAKAIYRLSDGLSYAKADEEAAGFAAETGTKWYEQV